MVVAVELEGHHAPVLQLGTGLANGVDQEQRDEVGHEDGENLIGGYRLGLHAVHDEAHDPGVGVVEQRGVGDAGEDRHEGGEGLFLGDPPEPVQGAADGGAVLRAGGSLGHGRASSRVVARAIVARLGGVWRA